MHSVQRMLFLSFNLLIFAPLLLSGGQEVSVANNATAEEQDVQKPVDKGIDFLFYSERKLILGKSNSAILLGLV